MPAALLVIPDIALQRANHSSQNEMRLSPNLLAMSATPSADTVEW